MKRNFARAARAGVAAAALLAATGASAQAERLTLGVFPGVESGQAESYEILDRYMPFAQYLSAKVGTQVVLVPVKVPGAAMQRMVEGGGYKLFFGPPVFASEAIKKAGFVPVVIEEERIRAVFVVKNTSRLQSFKDFAPTTKVAMPGPKLLLTILARETLAKNKIELQPSARQHMTATEGVILALDNDMSEVAVMRDRAAKKLFADKPFRYRIVGESVDAPGFALIAHKSVSDAMRNKVRQAALALNSDSSGLATEARSGMKTSAFVVGKNDEFAALQLMMDTWAGDPK